MCIGHVRGPCGPLHVGLGVTQGDIFENRAVENIVVLQHETDLLTEVTVVQGIQIDAVKVEGSRSGFQQTGE